MTWPWTTQVTDYSKEVSELQKGLATLNSRVLALELEQEAFRNKVLRKVQKARDGGNEPSEGQSETLYNGMLIPSKE